MKIEDAIPVKLNKILVGVDGSEDAEKAGAFAIDLARRYSASLILFFVARYPPNDMGPTITDVVSLGEPQDDPLREKKKQTALASMHEIGELARKMNISVDEQIIDTSTTITRIISDYSYRNSVDVIVVGSSGLTEFEATIEESVSQGLVEHAPCTVVVVK